MQSSESAGLPPNSLSTEASIKQDVFILLPWLRAPKN